MTVDGPEAADPPPGQRALEQYRARLRPWRIVYAIVIVLVVIGGLVGVKIAYNHGEISHATLKTASVPAPSVALKSPSTTLAVAWTSPDHTAIGTPYWGGTLVTYSTHTVTGRDALTGGERWSYTRSDRTVCTAAQIGGVTVAVFELNGNCDELTAINTTTGTRNWTRTVDKDGQPLNGHPSYVVGPYTLMMTTPTVIYAISPTGTSTQQNGGLDRWVFGQPGCTINGATLGTAGALISQTCAPLDCTDKAYCGGGPQLLLRDGTTGRSDDAKNPDQIKWNLLGNTSIPVSSGAVITATEPGSSQLDVLEAAEGKTLASLELKAPTDSAPSTIETARAQLIRIGGVTYVIAANQTSLLWSAPTTALPTVTATDDATVPDLSHSVLSVPAAQGIDQLEPGTGAVGQSRPTPPLATGSLSYPFGTGFIIAGPSTTVYR